MENNYIIIISYDGMKTKEVHYCQDDELMKYLKYYTGNGAIIISVNYLYLNP